MAIPQSRVRCQAHEGACVIRLPLSLSSGNESVASDALPADPAFLRRKGE